MADDQREELWKAQQKKGATATEPAARSAAELRAAVEALVVEVWAAQQRVPAGGPAHLVNEREALAQYLCDAWGSLRSARDELTRAAGYEAALAKLVK
jgi:hypothetical protein